jgi:hypothetical protein
VDKENESYKAKKKKKKKKKKGGIPDFSTYPTHRHHYTKVRHSVSTG